MARFDETQDVDAALLSDLQQIIDLVNEAEQETYRLTSTNVRGPEQLIERRLNRGALTTNDPFPVGVRVLSVS